MKQRLFFILALYTTLALAQQEASVWYFGENAGLKFNPDGSTTALTDGKLVTLEGCATLSDTNGALLFYTDGITIWNKNHQVMVNGTGLMGHPSSTQSATIVQKPGAPNLYYVFTLDAKAGVYGFRYSEIDVTLDGGLGAVTTNKNVLIYTPACEKISVVKHANGTDYWIITHGWENDVFYAHLLSASGLNTIPVTSSSGAIVYKDDDNYNAQGYMKISPDGTKLALCHQFLYLVELFDFNTSTGTVSNNQVIYNKNKNLVYGVEFSPNSNVLYVDDISSNNIYQYDLTSPNIAKSENLIYTSGFYFTPGALQLGPDGKIYVAIFNQTKLSVINNPNTVGIGCNFQPNSVDLGGKKSQLGLPAFNQSFFDPTFSVDNLCIGASTKFTLSTTVAVNSATWEFGDGTTSADISPAHQYTSPGKYVVTVNATAPNGKSTKSKEINISPSPIIANPIPNQSVCGTDSMNYDLTKHNAAVLGSQSPSNFEVKYYYSQENAQENVNEIKNPINNTTSNQDIYYSISAIGNSNCKVISSFKLVVTSLPMANTANPIFICDDVTNDGLGTFNLQNNNSTLLGTQNSNQFTVGYYENQSDADTKSNLLSLNYQNTSNPQTIFARVENNENSSCFVTTSFQIGLYKMSTANPVQDLITCDDDSNDGKEFFDLTTQNSTILGSQSQSDFAISYHQSLADANSGTKAVTNNYTNTANPQTMYARVVNTLSAACYTTTSFQLIIRKKPELDLKEEYSICEGKSISITAPLGFTSYLWSNDSKTPKTTIKQAGTYSLTVTKNYGDITCETTKAIVVTNSNIATITKIDTQDWTTSENTLTIHATGDGEYEYSIDGINYQESPQFFGLNNGQYKIYVKDKRGCGIKTDEVFLLMYPKFFTPNGDGTNDTWHIKYSDNEPKMKLIIYDRYGKMITSYNGLKVGWDGRYNGQLLPSDDYWFVVQRENGKEYKGHFTMKR